MNKVIPIYLSHLEIILMFIFDLLFFLMLLERISISVMKQKTTKGCISMNQL